MKYSKILSSIIKIIIILVAVEIFLQFVSYISPTVHYILLSPYPVIPNIIKDSRLEHRPNPAWPDHDKKGFRNKFVPRNADIVALGDSQTYGVKVLRHQSWPQQLARLSNKKIYNMACGGYGQAHHLILLEEAIEFKPKLIIETLYTGNDLYDSYRLIHKREGGPPTLKTKNKGLIDYIRKLENIKPLKEEINKAAGINKEKEKEQRNDSAHKAIRDFLSDYSKTWGFLRAVKNTTVKLHGLTAVASLDSGFRSGAKPRTESHSSTPLQAWLSGAWVNLTYKKTSLYNTKIGL